MLGIAPRPSTCPRIAFSRTPCPHAGFGGGSRAKSSAPALQSATWPPVRVNVADGISCINARLVVRPPRERPIAWFFPLPPSRAMGLHGGAVDQTARPSSQRVNKSPRRLPQHIACRGPPLLAHHTPLTHNPYTHIPPPSSSSNLPNYPHQPIISASSRKPYHKPDIMPTTLCHPIRRGRLS